jgi:hypothetical protein
MSAAELLPAPEIASGPPLTKWERESQAFLRLLPTLLDVHRGKYVAVHNEQVVDSGDDQIEVAMRVYDRFGYQPIYVGLVSDQPTSPVRVPSPRLFPKTSRP